MVYNIFRAIFGRCSNNADEQAVTNDGRYTNNVEEQAATNDGRSTNNTDEQASKAATIGQSVKEVPTVSQDYKREDLDILICQICLDKKCEILFLPCAHLASCLQCSNAFNKCPVCRKDIKKKIKVFY